MRADLVISCGMLVLVAAWHAWAAGAEPAAAPVDLTAPPEGIGVLLVTGIDYPGHPWRETAPVLKKLLEADPRLRVRIVEDPHALASPLLHGWDVVIIHFQNWEQPGPGPEARENLARFVAGGKGLVLTHFACGAWHKEWPGFKGLAGRVWDPALRAHDPHGKFRVDMVDTQHPITRGMESFETVDELYTCLAGDAPIHVLASAVSKVDGKVYPMAFVLDYGKGRVFHSVLGHDGVAYTNNPSVGELMRRGCAWAAGIPAVRAMQEGRRFEAQVPVALDYLLFLPEGYGADPDKTWPLILFLHGAGERGSDLNRVKVHGPPKIVEQQKDFPFVVVSPQCPAGQWWDPFALNALLDDVIKNHQVDVSRVYLTGLSMGGFGTWDLAARTPERFAAIVPICGGGNPSVAAFRLRDVPAWVFHGDADPVVPVRLSDEMVEALKKGGANVKYTRYPGVGHDAWTETYNNEALYEWLLSHQRKPRGAAPSRRQRQDR